MSEERLDAWIGLCSVDADKSITDNKEVALLIQNIEHDKRGNVIRWIGNELWRIICTRYTLPYSNDSRKQILAVHIDNDEDFMKGAAILYDAMLSIDSNACLVPDKTIEAYSLRLPVAFTFFMGGNCDKSFSIINRKVQYTLLPPKSGWSSISGYQQQDDAFKPRELFSPTETELKKATIALLTMSTASGKNLSGIYKIGSKILQATTLNTNGDTNIRSDVELIATEIEMVSNAEHRLSRVTNQLDVPEAAAYYTSIKMLLNSKDVIPFIPIIIRKGILPALSKCADNGMLFSEYIKLLKYCCGAYKNGVSDKSFREEVRFVASCIDGINSDRAKQAAKELRADYGIID